MQTWKDSNFIIFNSSQRLKIIPEIKNASLFKERKSIDIKWFLFK